MHLRDVGSKHNQQHRTIYRWFHTLALHGYGFQSKMRANVLYNFDFADAQQHIYVIAISPFCNMCRLVDCQKDEMYCHVVSTTVYLHKLYQLKTNQIWKQIQLKSNLSEICADTFKTHVSKSNRRRSATIFPKRT